MRTPPEEPVKPKKVAVPLPEAMASHFPNYEILRILGRGGMGAVYLARQTSLNRLVAIKILPAELDDGENNFTQRFKNEAQAMAQLSHPGIVAVYDFGQTTSGLLYIVMEYIDGTDVALMVERQGRLPSAHAMAITAHVCDALAYSHGKGIIHRDIKPSNIMIGYDGVVKVADFGLAKMRQTEQSGLTQSGMVMGTLHFMAPEALTLGRAVDQRADIYAVGVMLYQMLTGKLPRGLFEMPSLQVKGLDPRYDQIVAKALREDRNLRYASAGELRHDLDAILTQPVARVEASAAEAPNALNTQARPRKPGTVPDPRHPARAAAAARIGLHPQAGKKSRTSLLWTLLLVGAVFGGAAWLVLRQPKEPPGSASAGSSEPGQMADQEQQDAKAPPFTNTLGMKFVPVPGTKVLFCIHETRRQDYAAYANEIPGVDGSWKTQQRDGIPNGDNDDHPVVGVTWEDAVKFCEWLSKKEGKTSRLPTDEEWSRAVGLPEESGATPRQKGEGRGGGYPWGTQWPPPSKAGNFRDETLHEQFPAWRHEWIRGYWDGYATTAPVGSFEPNTFGIYDLSGNVWEWCEDWLDATKSDKVLRGAGWNNMDGGGGLLSSNRHGIPPTHRNEGLGFRVVLVDDSAHPSAAAAASPGNSATPKSSGAALTTPRTLPDAATKNQPFINTLGMKFLPVPGTDVLFCIHETRIDNYESFIKTTNRQWTKPTFDQSSDHPAVLVSYEDAKSFCDWLANLERQSGKLGQDQVYRLPTDHEWSCAVGIGNLEDFNQLPFQKKQELKNIFPWGTSFVPPIGFGNYAGEELQKMVAAKTHDYLNSVIVGYRDKYLETAPVGSFSANSFGIYDLSGNVGELCEDLFGGNERVATQHVVRGGNWGLSIMGGFASSYRHTCPKQTKHETTGFRCVLSKIPNQ